MAPEQAHSGQIDQRADLFSAGVVLWELLTGRRLWGSASQTEILARVAAGNIPPLAQAATGIHPDLVQICTKALAPHREDRYATAAHFAADLEAFARRNLEPRNERDLGRLVAEAFGEERERLRTILEQQLSPRARAQGPGPTSLPEIGGIPDAQTGASVVENALFAHSYARGPSASVEPHARTAAREGSASPPSSLPGARRPFKVFVGAASAALLVGAAAFATRQSPPVRAATALDAAKVGASAAAPKPTERGVTENEITLGMSAVFSGPSRELGENMKLGLETAFWSANSAGGVHGRKLRLVALDDGYEASRVAATMQDLFERRVFAVIGNVGTPTSVVAAPIASKQKTIFFGAFTGAPVLRQDPPDRYVFNYRASYREETAASVRYLTEVQKIPIDQIVVFAQEDSYGDAGFEGVSKAVRQLSHDGEGVLRVGYKRNTIDVENAVAQVLRYHDKTEVVRQAGQYPEVLRVAKHPVKAVIMVATYRAAAKFIQKLRDVPRLGKPLLFNVSFVGTDALAEDLKGISRTLCQGVYVTQVVPPFSSGATGVRRYRDALAAYQPQARPGFVSLEGFVVGSLFVEALKRVGSDLTTERLVDSLEQFNRVDLGFGAPLSFSLSEHQGSHKVWGTRLDDACEAQPVDLD
jgi:ABC-type branched-subunit amino acid transport system substrate-binding protein